MFDEDVLNATPVLHAHASVIWACRKHEEACTIAQALGVVESNGCATHLLLLLLLLVLSLVGLLVVLRLLLGLVG
jgi:hypothetical protein